MSVPGQRNLEKHRRYLGAYQRGGWFWGLGVEHETYMMSSQTRTVRTVEATAMRPERYSVNYYAAYRPGALRAALDRTLADTSGSGLVLPVLVNSHSFTHCDVFGEHRTTYERIPKPNPRFAGRTMEEWARDLSPWLRTEMDRAYMWDGDTVEFMTQNFYCATVDRVMAELEGAEARFVMEMASLPRTGVLAAYGPLRLASPRNEPFATHLTHPRGFAMFNNGTLHVNVTLPTRLGWSRTDPRPLWPAHFLESHRALARMIQWLEPLWIARFGSGDPFAELGEVRDVCDGRVARFAAGSQRLAVSRYIGLGTFDTERMPTGKILQMSRVDAGALPWYDWLYERTHYSRLDVVGLDLNYSKHGAHGLELRFFDQMPMADLRAVLGQVTVLCDVARVATRRGGVSNPRTSPIWIAAAGEALLEGMGWRVPAEYLNGALVAGGASPEAKEPLPVAEALDWVFQRLRTVGDGYCVRVMGGAVGIEGGVEVVGACGGCGC